MANYARDANGRQKAEAADDRVVHHLRTSCFLGKRQVFSQKEKEGSKKRIAGLQQNESL
jgi:hypothetical protein